MARRRRAEVEKSGWTEERRERFLATMAAKKAANEEPPPQMNAEQPQVNGTEVMLSVNGQSYPIEVALALHGAVEKLLRTTPRSGR